MYIKDAKLSQVLPQHFLYDGLAPYLHPYQHVSNIAYVSYGA